MNQREYELGPVDLEPSALIIKPLRVIFGEKLFWTLNYRLGRNTSDESTAVLWSTVVSRDVNKKDQVSPQPNTMAKRDYKKLNRIKPYTGGKRGKVEWVRYRQSLHTSQRGQSHTGANPGF